MATSRLFTISFFFLFTSTAFASFTTEDLYRELMKSNPTNREQVLAALPQVFKDNFVLIRDSRSRQAGTPDLPRILHFSKSADLVISSSGHTTEDDVAAEDLEVMEFDRANARWRFATISFAGGKLTPPQYGLRSCTRCHGDNPRPIWGEYHDWPTSYGGDKSVTDKMLPDEMVQFRAFTSKAKTHEAYKHLNIVETEWGYRLAVTGYAFPNTVLTARLGARHSQILFARMKLSPLYSELRGALLNQLYSCPGNEVLTRIKTKYNERLINDPNFAAKWNTLPAWRAITQVLRLLDIDTSAELRMETFPRAGFPSENALLLWNAGSDYLQAQLGANVLHEMLGEKPALRQMFANQISEFEELWRVAFASTNEDLEELEKTDGALYMKSLFQAMTVRVVHPAIKEHTVAAVCAAILN